MVLMLPGEMTHRITLVLCSVLVINTILSKLFSFISDSFREVLFHFIAVCAGTCRDLKFPCNSYDSRHHIIKEQQPGGGAGGRLRLLRTNSQLLNNVLTSYDGGVKKKKKMNN